MARQNRHRRWLGIIGTVLAAFVLAGILLDRWLQGFLPTDKFRETMGRLTSIAFKVHGAYAPIQRVGFLTVTTPGFLGTNGYRMTKTIEAQQVKARLNAWAIFAHRWELSIDIGRGFIELQPTQPQPIPKKKKGWLQYILPEHTWMRDVNAESVNAITMFGGKEGGIYRTKLRVRSNGEDYDYWARGGTFHLPRTPELRLQRLQMRVTSPRLTVPDAEFAPMDGAGSLKLHGSIGMRDDRSFEAEIAFDKMPLAPWCGDYRGSIGGVVNGHISCRGDASPKPPTQSFSGSVAIGELEVVGGELRYLSALNELAGFVGVESLRQIKLNRFQIRFGWQYPRVDVTHFETESKGVFHLKGQFSVERNTLKGIFELGTTEPYLRWLPHAETRIFTGRRNGYLWTTIHVGGTVQHPEEDLSPRVQKAFRSSPLSLISLVLRAVEELVGSLFSGKL